MATPTIGEFTGFPPEAFTFYAGLEDDNSKAYFDEHRDTYEQCIRLPMEELLASVAHEFGRDGKVFRPNRDVRFSKDKSPYKVHCGAVINDGFDDSPVYYTHISSEGLMAATGYYRMSRDQIQRFYRAVDDEHKGEELVGLVATARDDGLEVGGSELKTSPRGYDNDHPRVELLRHKSLTVSRSWPVHQWVHSREAEERVTGVWRAADDINAWLRTHVGAAADEPEGRPR